MSYYTYLWRKFVILKRGYALPLSDSLLLPGYSSFAFVFVFSFLHLPFCFYFSFLHFTSLYFEKGDGLRKWVELHT